MSKTVVQNGSGGEMKVNPQIERSIRASPILVFISLAFSDVLAVSVSLGLAVILRSLISPVAFINSYT